MVSKEEYEEAERQYREYWKPVEELFRKAGTREEICAACDRAAEKTGMKYCFGIGYHGDPAEESGEPVEFHGWMYDPDHEMITVWYCHQDVKHG